MAMAISTIVNQSLPSLPTIHHHDSLSKTIEHYIYHEPSL